MKKTKSHQNKKNPQSQRNRKKKNGKALQKPGSPAKNLSAQQFVEKPQENFRTTTVIDDQYRFDRLIRIISKLIDRKHIRILEQLIARLHSSDISYVTEFMGEEEKAIIFSLIHKEDMANVISEMSKENRSLLLKQRDPGWIASVVDNMDSDDAADILAELPEERSTFILKRINQKDADVIKSLMEYNENTAGGIMDTEFFAVSENAKISEVIREFKELVETEDIEDIHSTFVIDENNKLVGIIPIRKLILYRGTTNVSQIMEQDLITVNVNMDQEEVAAIFKRHNLISTPVVDEQNTLMGRITIDDIVDVIDAETSEDIYRMAGVSIDSHVNANVRSNLRRRFPWLLLNLATAAISAAIVGMFSSVIDQMAILAAFMPLIAGLGGNAGAQVIAIAVRSIALGELTFRNASKVLYKEIFTGALNGILLGIILGVISYLITEKLFLGIIICWAMIMNVFTASIAGLIVPLSLKRVGVDPAVAANIFVTPMTDALGFFFFLGLAKLFLGHLL